MGRGLADGFTGSGLDGWREELGAERIALDDGAELLDGGGSREGGEAVGLELGVAGEVVEEGDHALGVEEGEQGGDGEVVAGGEVVELHLAVEIIAEDAVEVGGIGEDGLDAGGVWGRGDGFVGRGGPGLRDGLGDPCRRVGLW
ncbi:MAG: hypothetical protein IPJ41_07865 [Phycisphaerales bacterium]|nr:hypothetical protein [Phycisphaerales bacterium]